MSLAFARRMQHMRASEIREILKVTERPEIISFAGGLPAPELFPVREFLEAGARVLETDGARALQYSTTEGFGPLRDWIAARLNRQTGAAYGRDNILITHGSQQALDLSGKVFLDPGDTVICESPTYLAAISAFRAYGCTFAEVPTDDLGMLPEQLESVLDRTPTAKLIYVIPDFQNPTGRSWSGERRKRLAEIAARRNLPVLEDAPYRELRFEGEALPSVASFDTAGTVLSTGSFSKILCPGIRIGWIAGNTELIRKYVLVKQCTDLQCNTFAQMQIARYLETNDVDAHISRIRAVYARRRTVALAAMDAAFPASVRFTRPEGGLFAWVELPEGQDSRELLRRSLEHGVAFVPGGAFFPERPQENTLRLNFSNTGEERIREGMGILGRLLQEALG